MPNPLPISIPQPYTRKPQTVYAVEVTAGERPCEGAVPKIMMGTLGWSIPKFGFIANGMMLTFHDSGEIEGNAPYVFFERFSASPSHYDSRAEFDGWCRAGGVNHDVDSPQTIAWIAWQASRASIVPQKETA